MASLTDVSHWETGKTQVPVRREGEGRTGGEGRESPEVEQQRVSEPVSREGCHCPNLPRFWGEIFLAIQAFAETADGWKDFREGAISLPLHFYQGAFTLFPPLTVVKRENAGRAARRLGSCRLAFSASNQLCPLVNRSASFASMCPFVKPVGPCGQYYFNGCTFFFF